MYNKFKSLLSVGQCNIQGQFIKFSGISESLVDISGNFILVEFGRILRLIKLGRFLRYVDISGNFKLVNPSGFFKF